MDRPRVKKSKQPTSKTPIGTEVVLYPDFGAPPKRTKTRSEVSEMCGSKVIWLEGVSGCYAIDCVEVLS